ncbi:hypothetical protein TNCT_674381 [Trichonephila clavata]|uniref:Uncharacterized protein n=1 Tax=Trichonephila clavata TaxID=2740835 RepID=A0A8X6LF65_TRICU|nr:hypothetical protein TNCT_674381 [Trichonephila clavata]
MKSDASLKNGNDSVELAFHRVHCGDEFWDAPHFRNQLSAYGMAARDAQLLESTQPFSAGDWFRHATAVARCKGLSTTKKIEND